jgi:hypothetical protein
MFLILCALRNTFGSLFIAYEERFLKIRKKGYTTKEDPLALRKKTEERIQGVGGWGVGTGPSIDRYGIQSVYMLLSLLLATDRCHRDLSKFPVHTGSYILHNQTSYWVGITTNLNLIGRKHTHVDTELRLCPFSLYDYLQEHV